MSEKPTRPCKSSWRPADKCSYSLNCYGGGYQHPGECNRCLCPEGVGGTYCDKNEDPHPATLDCGGNMVVGDDWEEISSPGYPNPGYETDQKCSWLIRVTHPTFSQTPLSLTQRGPP